MTRLIKGVVQAKGKERVESSHTWEFKYMEVSITVGVGGNDIPPTTIHVMDRSI